MLTKMTRAVLVAVLVWFQAASCAAVTQTELEARLDELQAVYEQQFDDMLRARARDAAVIKELRSQIVASSRLDDEMLGSLERRHLALVPDLDGYSGISVKKDTAMVTMGAQADVKLSLIHI